MERAAADRPRVDVVPRRTRWILASGSACGRDRVAPGHLWTAARPTCSVRRPGRGRLLRAAAIEAAFLGRNGFGRSGAQASACLPRTRSAAPERTNEGLLGK